MDVFLLYVPLEEACKAPNIITYFMHLQSSQRKQPPRGPRGKYSSAVPADISLLYQGSCHEIKIKIFTSNSWALYSAHASGLSFIGGGPQQYA